MGLDLTTLFRMAGVFLVILQSKKGRKGKKKAKTVAKTTAVRVGVISNRTLTTTRTTNVVRKNRVVSKKPARR